MNLDTNPLPSKPHPLVDQMRGKTFALEVILRAVILSSPNEMQIRQNAAQLLELLRTSILPSGMADSAQDGIDEVERTVLRP